MKLKKRWLIPAFIVLLMGLLSIPEIIHKNQGESTSFGSVRNGKLQNGWLVPFHGKNFQYFSRFSYYILNCGYVHHNVYGTIMAAYETCETTCPEQKFWLMECSRNHGGNMLFHWTHENGTSVDFMVPTIRGDQRDVMSDHFGLFHYLLQYDAQGRFKLNPKTKIDFESMARHILAIDDACKRNGLRIRKILFNTHILDELFRTSAGQEILKRDIFIPRRLNDLVNRYHDDHYHIDFEIVGT